MSSKKVHKLADVFADVATHKIVANIIINHSTNKSDIREIALEGLDMKSGRKILDLGCGFGFFTRALKGKVHPEALVTGIDRFKEYEQLYIDSCITSGLKGKFIGSGKSVLSEFDSNCFDIILCSYALYFFPDIIPQISRILKNDGVFIAITHSKPHLKELTSYIKNILEKHNINPGLNLPYEKLINNFSNKNGYQLLSPWFENIRKIEYKSSLVFSDKDFSDFIKFLRIKHSFFISDNVDKELINIIINQLRKDIQTKKRLKITKDDIIFVSSQPFK